MSLKISRTLEGIIARTAFHTAQQGIRHALLDHLVLELLREEESLAYQMLSAHLKDWELYQIRLRLERQLAEPTEDDHEPEAFFRRFSEQLRERLSEGERASTAHALLAILEEEQSLSAQIFSRYGITAPTLREALRGFLHEEEGAQEPRRLEAANDLRPTTAPITLLEQFGLDLTAEAREGRIEAVIGRDKEIERVVQILSRRKKNNPILIGEAGVGKSAIVEGLALRIVEGRVPYTIARKRLFSLDIASLVAGTKFRGEFEERMHQLLNELSNAQDTILFIDEIHTIVGAGSSQGSLDTANILKPALARGQVQTIGATTLLEYREIERDAALERRFQPVLVEPTSQEVTLEILQQVAPLYERHHRVRYSPEALRACVALSHRYITHRHFPDKAIDLLDEAGSRAHLRSAEPPALLHELERSLATAQQERREAIAALHYERATEARLREIALKNRFEEEHRAWQRALQATPTPIGEEEIQQVIVAMTGIPAERLSQGEISRLRGLSDYLAGRVVGQKKAVERLSGAIRRARTGLQAENRPLGVFLFVGPTGVGKTLLAKEVSKWLFDEQRGLIRLDMSEYAEKHQIARLIGSPPGYVGYGEGGQLTEAVRRQPYAVVLFDEVEKAHPDLFNTLLQLFDEGHLTDGMGRRVDFRNTVLIMTSNLGSQQVAQRPQQVGYSTPSKAHAVEQSPRQLYRKALERTLSPEFLNRIDEILLFEPLRLEQVEQIVALEVEGLARRASALGYRLRITPSAKRRLAKMGYEERYGARALKRTLQAQVEEPLSELIIDGRLTVGGTILIESQRSKEGVRLRVA